jgi:Xaa-Pro aminopeptidase
MSVGRGLAERVGEGHDHAAMLEGRRRAIAVVQALAQRVIPGMAEDEGLDLVLRTLREHGFEADWAAPELRFGINTAKRYGEPSEAGVVLRHEDIWFVDIGPLWRAHECDFAQSYAVGEDPERHRLVRDLHEVFDSTVQYWRESSATGVDLYRHAAVEARARGWQLDLGTGGHRIGRHPHALLHDGALSESAFTPSPGLWMLEIHLRHPDRPYGAFFEDLLLDAADE